MHEISLVEGLLQQLKELAEENNGSRIISITMEIGPLCGVVVDAFLFGFEVLSSEDALFKDAKMIINVPEVDYTCTGCNHVQRTNGPKPSHCPKCDDPILISSGGEDLILQSVEIE